MKQHTFAKFLLGIALGHILVGLIIFGDYLILIPQKGWLNVVGPDFMEGAIAVWFLLFAWPLLLIVIQFWNKDEWVKLPFLNAAFLGSLLGISLMPASGFWLLLILAGVAMIQNKIHS